jgi:hypothetical protein
VAPSFAWNAPSRSIHAETSFSETPFFKSGI